MVTQLIQITIPIIIEIIPGKFLEVLSEIFLVFEEENDNVDISSLIFRCDLSSLQLVQSTSGNIFSVPNPNPDPSPILDPKINPT
jgi:hypothetical protein